MGRLFRRALAIGEDRRVFVGASLLLFSLGIVLRALWLTKAGRLEPIPSEALNVARAFATTGRFADAYGPGTGLTAHMAPGMPLLAGAVYRLLGPTSPSAEIALIVIALALFGLSLWAVNALMREFQVSRPARLIGLAVVCLAPLYFHLEVTAHRVWEGAVAAAGLNLALLAAVKMDASGRPLTWRGMAAFAFAGAIMFMFSPAVALAIYGCVGLLALRRGRWWSFPAAAALSLAALVALSYPWAVRNEAIFGQKVWSRTNFGFNYALGFHDGAVDPKDPRQVFRDRLAAVDPYTSPAALRTLHAVGGEAAYSKLWTQRTTAWIEQHPLASARIALRHLSEMFFPPRWFWDIYSEKATAVAPRQALIWVLSILGLAGLAWRLAQRRWRYLYVLAGIGLCAAPYVLAQPILRYRYAYVAVLTFLAADALWSAAIRLLPRSGETISKSATAPASQVASSS